MSVVTYGSCPRRADGCGDSAELSVTVVMDGDVTAGDDEWVSSNPEVATVEDGRVSLYFATHQWTPFAVSLQASTSSIRGRPPAKSS